MLQDGLLVLPVANEVRNRANVCVGVARLHRAWMGGGLRCGGKGWKNAAQANEQRLDLCSKEYSVKLQLKDQGPRA